MGQREKAAPSSLTTIPPLNVILSRQAKSLPSTLIEGSPPPRFGALLDRSAIP